ncbi:MAG: DUF1992 domain-containing protein [Nocardioidaceae bacterium]
MAPRSEEQRLRRAAITKAQGKPPDDADPPVESAESGTDQADPGARLEQKALWVDLQIERAMADGAFDNLPGAGKPIHALGSTHDPDWWVKGLIERERLSGLLPPALALRNEDAEFDEQVDRETTELGVPRLVEDFNARVVEARRQLLGGPPVVTQMRDVAVEVAAWRVRRDERRAQQRRLMADAGEGNAGSGGRRRWWRHGRVAARRE